VSNADIISTLRRLYRDILRGCTQVRGKSVYVKHFKESDIGFLSELKRDHSEDAKEQGLPTEEEKIIILIEQEMWDKENEDQITNLQALIANKIQTKTKLVLKSQIDSVNKQLEKYEEELSEVNEKREELLGLTREKYADKKSSEEIARIALYKDEELSKPLYSKEKYEDLEIPELNKVIVMYGESIKEFNQQNIKRIAASTFFMNPFFLCKSDPVRFYGKPVVELTNYQSDLFSIGIGYKNVLEKGQSPSQELYLDPDALVEWYEAAGSIAKMAEKRRDDTSGRTVMGATKRELEGIAGTENTIDLVKEAERRGGTMNMKDFLEIHADNKK
jgi:hypothetical protein